ncbi:MAG: hypothetical protein LUP96_04255 [Methylococcaceae bacterium]|nr:hypothetical protein [Methylococcaceae bacterium]
MNAIIDTLKINGLLFYQAFTREKATHTPPHNPDYLLVKNELLALFAPLTVVFCGQETKCSLSDKNWIAS